MMECTIIEKSSKSAKNPFSPEEDRKLTQLVKFFSRKKDINWTYISQQMQTRNARQCKDRWTNYLDARVNRKDFTPEENYFLLVKVEELGRKWKKIASMMNNRTDVSLKSQYRKLMRRHASRENVFNLCMEAYSTRRKANRQNVEPESARITDRSDVKLNEMNFDIGDFDSFDFDKTGLELI